MPKTVRFKTTNLIDKMALITHLMYKMVLRIN
jgi:hypothetical protein